VAEERRDREELSALFNGCSISMLGQIFGLDNREVAKRIVDLQASGERDGHPIYNLAAAARYLVDPIINIEEYILTLKPSDLPVALQKAYWEGQNSRLKWEENAKQLWRTEKVRDVFVDLFKVVRGTVVMFEDSVESTVGLTDAQRKTLRQLSDGLLDTMRSKLIDEFSLQASLNEFKSAA
jgi:hypothetical protein